MTEKLIEIFKKHVPDSLVEINGSHFINEDASAKIDVIVSILREYATYVRDEQIKLSAAFAASLVQWERGCGTEVTKEHYEHFLKTLKVKID